MILKKGQRKVPQSSTQSSDSYSRQDGDQRNVIVQQCRFKGFSSISEIRFAPIRSSRMGDISIIVFWRYGIGSTVMNDVIEILTRGRQHFETKLYKRTNRQKEQ